MLERTTKVLQERAAIALVVIETRLDRLMQAWLLFAGLACAARLALSPLPGGLATGTMLPFLLVITAPFASMVLALRWFSDGDRMPQPSFRLAQFGRWRTVARDMARANPLYGPAGLMVSLLIGMLVNVPIRALEYLASMPALPAHAPGWLERLHFLMTFDVVLLTSLYAVAFVAALRRVPLFPRLLVAIWLVDVGMQLMIATLASTGTGLPAGVAAALQPMLKGNIDKVLVSVALWLPYLLLSARVNITYRHRIAG